MDVEWSGDGVRQVKGRLRELSRLALEVGLTDEAEKAELLILLIDRLTEDARSGVPAATGPADPRTQAS